MANLGLSVSWDVDEMMQVIGLGKDHRRRREARYIGQL